MVCNISVAFLLKSASELYRIMICTQATTLFLKSYYVEKKRPYSLQGWEFCGFVKISPKVSSGLCGLLVLSKHVF